MDNSPGKAESELTYFINYVDTPICAWSEEVYDPCFSWIFHSFIVNAKSYTSLGWIPQNIKLAVIKLNRSNHCLNLWALTHQKIQNILDLLQEVLVSLGEYGPASLYNLLITDAVWMSLRAVLRSTSLWCWIKYTVLHEKNAPIVIYQSLIYFIEESEAEKSFRADMGLIHQQSIPELLTLVFVRLLWRHSGCVLNHNFYLHTLYYKHDRVLAVSHSSFKLSACWKNHVHSFYFFLPLCSSKLYFSVVKNTK